MIARRAVKIVRLVARRRITSRNWEILRVRIAKMTKAYVWMMAKVKS